MNMFEYINPGFYILSGIIILITLLSATLDSQKAEPEGKQPKKKTYEIFVITFVVGAPLIASLITKNNIDENIHYFQNNASLKCSSISNSYIISRSSGWSLFDDGFIQESVFIRADKCSKVMSKIS